MPMVIFEDEKLTFLAAFSGITFLAHAPVLVTFWYARGMYYPVCGMMHIKEPLLLIRKSSPCGGSGFPRSLSGWSFTICVTPYNRKGARCSSVVRAFAHGAMGRRIDPSWGEPIARSSQCSMTGITKAVVCAILSMSMGWCI